MKKKRSLDLTRSKPNVRVVEDISRHVPAIFCNVVESVMKLAV